MSGDTVEGFFAERAALDTDAYVELDYTFECTGDPREAAAHLCREQSTAQWHRIGIDEDFRPRFAAKVLELSAEPQASGFSLDVPGAVSGPVHRCRVTIAHPHGNFGARLPNLLSAIIGEGVFFVPGIPIIRLEDLRLPDAYLAQFPGPQFGIHGIREQLGISGRPIFLGVVKPNLGLSPADFAQLAESAWMGGLDIAKDDEMLADAQWSPLATRARLCGAARVRAERATGERKGYMANVTDEVSRLIANHDVAVAAGATCVLVNALPVGLSGVRMLREHARVPVFGHFPMIAASSRVPGYGVHSRVYTRLQRLAGCDAVIMPGFGSRMMTSDAEVLENVRACMEPMGSLKAALPIPGGSDSAETLPSVARRMGGVDFGFVVGRGVFGHPEGPGVGARVLREAWKRFSVEDSSTE